MTQHSIDNTQLSQTTPLCYDPNSDTYQQSFQHQLVVEIRYTDVKQIYP
ncbi:unnamed protein product [Rotaria socialis]|uniref:Uncharacterized protein n=1 Tax=Rotaria socialis TaxID=392032 RepID=A0A819YDB0_9BILA|nr:unnamed protein product [Rotaria socialis]